jgi:chromosome segregation ATPase
VETRYVPPTIERHRRVAQSGNGIDIGVVYQLLLEMSARMDAMSARMDTMSARMDTMSARMDTMSARLDSHDRKLDQLLDVANEHSRTLSDHTRQLDDLNAGAAELRSAVGGYHEAVVSQGIHYTELDGRVRRIERHLKFEPNGG